MVPWPDTMCPHHCTGSTTGPIPLWNQPTCGPLADLWMVPKVAKWLKNMFWDIGSMAEHQVSAPLPWFHNRTHPVVSQIMFFNHLATFGTIYKCPQVGWFHNGMGPVVEPGQWCGHMVSGHGTNVSNHDHLATFGTIYKSAKGPQVGRFHNGMGPVVEPGQWCGHMVSGHWTNGAQIMLL